MQTTYTYTVIETSYFTNTEVVLILGAAFCVGYGLRYLAD